MPSFPAGVVSFRACISLSEVNNPGCPWNKTNYSEEELKQRAERNDRNIDELIRIANENSDVINAVSVGNENTPDWGENNVPVERLISFAKKLRKETGKQVTFNEGVYEWEHLKELADELDIISIHSYPLWNGNTVEEALEVNKTWYKKVKEWYPGKPIVFSEVGWATDCADFKQMKEGQANEETRRDIMKSSGNGVTGNRLFLICLKLLTSLGKVEIDLMKQKNIGEYSTKTELQS